MPKGVSTPVEPKLTYPEWRARCAALLEGQSISAGFMREKEWRKLFIKGSTPEEAVRHAGTFFHNSRPFLERTRATAIAQAAYSAAARMYPVDLIELRQGARVVEKSKP
jgi:hypothetical protein